MIRNKNRAYWFGASDTAIIMGDWTTESFKNWWFMKLGFHIKPYSTWAMECGNLLEVPIIHEIERVEGKHIKLGKRPFYNPFLRLRCNYDGYTRDEVIEIKTTEKMFNKVPKNYYEQCQVLMFKKKLLRCSLYAYKMDEDDYKNPYFINIDYGKIKKFNIFYDYNFIHKQYLPRLRYLAKCLREKKFPVITEVKFAC